MKTHKHTKSQKAQDGSMTQKINYTRSPKRKTPVKILRGRFPFQADWAYLSTPGAGFGHSRGS